MMWDGKNFRCDCGGILENEDTLDDGTDLEHGSGWKYAVVKCVECKKESVVDITFDITNIEISEA